MDSKRDPVPGLVKCLNHVLVLELGAILQYRAHASISGVKGYKRLAVRQEANSLSEMRHAEALMERIAFLLRGKDAPETTPATVHTSGDPEKMLDFDIAGEIAAIRAYNNAIGEAMDGDNATRALLEANLRDEEAHLEYLQAQKQQITDIGKAQWLQAQIG